MCVCQPQGQAFPQTRSPPPRRAGTAARPGPADKKPQAKAPVQLSLKEDPNLPQLLEAALETVAWTPAGGQGRVSAVGKKPGGCLSSLRFAPEPEFSF